jgi:hypothetical protein
MTYKTFFTLALVSISAGLVVAGCAGNDGGERQLAQGSHTTTQQTSPAPGESPDRRESRRSEPKPGSTAKSSPERITREQQRDLRSASEKLRKKLGVARGPKAAESCVNLQGNPRLTRLIEANGRCKWQDAPGQDAAPPSMEVPSPTTPDQP